MKDDPSKLKKEECSDLKNTLGTILVTMCVRSSSLSVMTELSFSLRHFFADSFVSLLSEESLSCCEFLGF